METPDTDMIFKKRSGREAVAQSFLNDCPLPICALGTPEKQSPQDLFPHEGRVEELPSKHCIRVFTPFQKTCRGENRIKYDT